MLASTQGRGQALRWGANWEPHAQKSSAICKVPHCKDIHEVGIKGTPAESSNMARGTQGWKQSFMGMFQPPRQSSASHQHNAQEREQGEQISMVHTWVCLPCCISPWREERRMSHAKSEESQKASCEPLQFMWLFPRRRWAWSWRLKKKLLCRQNRIKPERL